MPLTVGGPTHVALRTERAAVETAVHTDKLDTVFGDKSHDGQEEEGAEGAYDADDDSDHDHHHDTTLGAVTLFSQASAHGHVSVRWASLACSVVADPPISASLDASQSVISPLAFESPAISPAACVH